MAVADTGEKPAKLTLESIASNEVAFSAGYSKGHKVKARNAKTPALIAILALVVTGFATVRYQASAQEVSNLRADYTLERTSYEDIAAKLVDARVQGGHLLSNCVSSVDDSTLCDALQKSLVDAELVDVTDPGKINPYESTASQLKTAVRVLVDINTKAAPAYKKLMAAIDAVQADTSSKTRDDFEKALTEGAKLVTEARELVASTEGKVWNDSLRTATVKAADALDEALKKARKANKGRNIRDYTGMTIPIEKLIEDLRERQKVLAEHARLWAQESSTGSSTPVNTGQNQGQQPQGAPQGDNQGGSQGDNQGGSQGDNQGGSQGDNQGGSQGGEDQPVDPIEDNPPDNPYPEIPEDY